jgi:hypothetical protein
MNIDRAHCHIRPGHNAAEGSLTCDPCSSRVRDALDDIVRLYPQVAEEVLCGTSTDDGPRGVGGSFHSGPPINLARIDRESRLARAYIVEIVASWADQVREDTGQPPRPGYPALKAEAVVLVRMWSWIRCQYWIADLAAELFDLQRTLQQLAGETRGRIPLGTCPRVVDYHPRTGAQIPCEQRLYARPGDRAVHCGQCSTTWPAYRWDELHRAQGAA